jgi:hypothetical protein
MLGFLFLSLAMSQIASLSNEHQNALDRLVREYQEKDAALALRQKRDNDRIINRISKRNNPVVEWNTYFMLIGGVFISSFLFTLYHTYIDSPSRVDHILDAIGISWVFTMYVLLISLIIQINPYQG